MSPVREEKQLEGSVTVRSHHAELGRIKAETRTGSSMICKKLETLGVSLKETERKRIRGG